jgi:hypothetical protein
MKMNELLANSNVMQIGVALCCTILSIGIAGAMIASAAKRESTKSEDNES